MNEEEIKKITELVILKSLPNEFICFSFEIKSFGYRHIHKDGACIVEPDLNINYYVYVERNKKGDKRFDTLEGAIEFLNSLETFEPEKPIKSSICNKQVVELIPKTRHR